MNSIDDFGAKFAEAGMRAMVVIGRSRGIDFNAVDLDALMVALRAEMKIGLSRFLDGGKVLAESGRSGWLPTLMQTECAEAATRALDTLKAA